MPICNGPDTDAIIRRESALTSSGSISRESLVIRHNRISR
jgi:hypothetical protein